MSLSNVVLYFDLYLIRNRAPHALWFYALYIEKKTYQISRHFLHNSVHYTFNQPTKSTEYDQLTWRREKGTFSAIKEKKARIRKKKKKKVEKGTYVHIHSFGKDVHIHSYYIYLYIYTISVYSFLVSNLCVFFSLGIERKKKKDQITWFETFSSMSQYQFSREKKKKSQYLICWMSSDNFSL